MAWDSLSNTWADQPDGWDTLYLTKSTSLGGALRKADTFRSLGLVGSLLSTGTNAVTTRGALLQELTNQLDVGGVLLEEQVKSLTVSSLLEGAGTKFVALQGLISQEQLKSLGLVGALQEVYLKEPLVRGLIQKVYTPSLGASASTVTPTVRVLAYDELGGSQDVTGVALRFHATDLQGLDLLSPVKRGEFSFEKLIGFSNTASVLNLNTYTDGVDLWAGGLRIWAEILTSLRAPLKPTAVGAKLNMLTYTEASPLSIAAGEYLCMAIEVDGASALGPQQAFTWYVSYDEVLV